ncbi:tRNA selenocysteine 1-associated protein 1 [Nilaparvata lugens]|uniref:tRNA selenocysteine 1-associated protein 1 n=1 Tax=Nilaparvata lugens TaxID=108931 RepID=UPI00193CD79A|nr:tRNA selenocysteine 1-associated protein 1 [Nilaparvata lugens]XP_039277974.1 tRNA selenocysteine 1-associated protein 1 [Nilaparvata lugens]XP_039277975.1 tRNA selenocysteine 1-associated protein 1 [Nilaparvata lugens]
MSFNPSANPGRIVWMGGIIKPYMTETFIVTAFLKMGHRPVLVKLGKRKKITEPPGYCFVHFASEEEAKKVLKELNGKLIPNSVPPAKFFLSTVGVKNLLPSYNVWLYDLSPDVDDNILQKTFSSRYKTVTQAKVILDLTGYSKGIAHIKFSSEDEQKHCLNHMNGFKGLGTRPLKVSSSLNSQPNVGKKDIPYIVSGSGNSSSQNSAYGFEKSYWNKYAAWQNSFRDPVHYNFATEMATINIIETSVQKEDDMDLIEHNTKLDIDSWNRELIQRDYNLWDAVECSKWLPVNILD